MADANLRTKSFKSPPIHRTPLYRAYAAWYGFLARCGNANGKNPTYRDVEIKMSFDEWVDWAVPAYEKFILENPGVSPAAARNGDQGHYEIGNISIISVQQNASQQKHNCKNPLLPDGTKRCSQCDRLLDKSHFPRASKSRDGLDTWCRECKNAYSKNFRARKRTPSLIGRAEVP